MSMEVIGMVLHHSQAVGTARNVLLGIAWHTGKDRMAGAFPSQSTLSKYANVSPRQVRRCINDVVDLGELHVISNGSYRNGSVASTNLYTILIDCPDYCDGSVNHRECLDPDCDHTSDVMRTPVALEADIQGR